jgi:hypothetical protein
MNQVLSCWSSHWPALCACVCRKYAHWMQSSCHCHLALMMPLWQGVSSTPSRISVSEDSVSAQAMPASVHRMASLEWVETVSVLCCMLLLGSLHKEVIITISITVSVGLHQMCVHKYIMKKVGINCRIWDSHSGGYEDCTLGINYLDIVQDELKVLVHLLFAIQVQVLVCLATGP